MGNCVTAHNDSGSAMKAHLSLGSKPDKLVIPSSPTKDNDKPIISCDFGVKQTSYRDFGSKEVTFFDSQAWLDSDYEDDFVSVRGDFTPSRGNTPVHHSFSVGNPRANGSLSVDRTPLSIPVPPQTEKKMRLSDLFQDSRSNQDFDDEDDQNGSNRKIDPKSESETPYVSGANSVTSELSSNGDFKPERERSVKSVQRCFPSLLSLSSCSSAERKNKTSPAHIME